MRTFYLFFFSLIFSINLLVAQTENDQKKQKEQYQKEIQKKQNEMISDFVNELEVDDFQKEIISQKLHSYVQKKQEISKQPGRELEKRERIDYLDKTHFSDVAAMSSPEVMNQIQDFITMKNPPKKKKKKKNRSKKS